MAKARRPKSEPLSNTEIRKILLQYFYDRNASATSTRGKKGAAVKIRDVRGELKESHGLKAHEIVSNLTYLLSQGWVKTDEVAKSFSTNTGTVVPSVTTYYIITAAGIDKIEGPGEFTRDPFRGIKIEATGQNVITVGDGNQVNVAFKETGEALSALADAVRSSTALREADKLSYIADIQSIQGQLAKPAPNRTVLQSLWAGLGVLDRIDGIAGFFGRVATLLMPLLGGGP